MKLSPVTSSIIASVGHDQTLGIIQINFLDGRSKRYIGVPASVIENILNADSPGNYYVQHIRSAGFTEVNA